MAESEKNIRKKKKEKEKKAAARCTSKLRSAALYDRCPSDASSRY